MSEFHYVECCKSNGWDFFENYGLGFKYNAAKISKMNLECRSCKFELQLINMKKETDLLINKLAVFEKSKATEVRSFAEIVKETKIESMALKQEFKVFSEERNTVSLASTLRQTTDEVMDINRRKLNVIISGLPECKDDPSSLASFVTHANSSFHLAQPLVVSDFTGARRLGHSPNLTTPSLSKSKPRLMCLKAASVSIRRVILDMWKSPKDEIGDLKIYV